LLLSLYSSLLLATLLVGAPYWLVRMATSGRYRTGLDQRLGRVPGALRSAVAGRHVVWIHAVSVGEVLAAVRLIGELEAATGDLVVLSTTTATGNALARTKLAPERVFFYPLDLAFAVRPYLRALRPRMLILMESELWPRMLAECADAGVPVAAVNARVSDRSFRRAGRVRAMWSRLLRRVTLFAAQSEEDARRLIALGVDPANVRTTGNLKYDIRAAGETPVTARLRGALAPGARVVVAGSTLPGEETSLLAHWGAILREVPRAVMILAPRHPDRFAEVEQMLRAKVRTVIRAGAMGPADAIPPGSVVLLDTIGDLASVYRLGHVAFVGGSLVPRGGHNPLEPAQFGVPVVMGGSCENFREIVARMSEAEAIVTGPADVAVEAITRFLKGDPAGIALGERGRVVFEAQSGATGRTIELLTGILRAGHP
jgi:3-deoxy-D-manno-octulosonic-acid transferase